LTEKETLVYNRGQCYKLHSQIETNGTTKIYWRCMCAKNNNRCSSILQIYKSDSDNIKKQSVFCFEKHNDCNYMNVPSHENKECVNKEWDVEHSTILFNSLKQYLCGNDGILCWQTYRSEMNEFIKTFRESGGNITSDNKLFPYEQWKRKMNSIRNRKQPELPTSMELFTLLDDDMRKDKYKVTKRADRFFLFEAFVPGEAGNKIVGK